MDNGWIQLHRKLLDNPIYRKPAWLSVWVTLLLLASHKEKEDFIWNGKPLKLNKGEFVTGRKRLSELTGVPATTIEDILSYLENQQQIRQQKTTKFRLITILKWSEYQKSVIKSDSKPSTDRQQSDTINKGNNVNNEITITKVIGETPVYGKSEINELLKFGHSLGFATTKERINRYAINRLLKGKTKEQLKKAAEVSQQIRNEPYAPQVNNWMDLEDKYLKLRDFFARQAKPKESKTLIL